MSSHRSCAKRKIPSSVDIGGNMPFPAGKGSFWLALRLGEKPGRKLMLVQEGRRIEPGSEATGKAPGVEPGSGATGMAPGVDPGSEA
ncbi:hypothetical protein, partial [Paenibacillus humicus]|uniref:hypothetical protein n=1 Tax=Paenibacillus humicus TaxID=412861 RepID=UPI001C3FAF26